MAAITSAQAGNWSSTSTWTGGTVPGNGDSVTISHAVTVDSNRTIGTSGVAGTAAVTISGSGTLTIANNVALTCRGDYIGQGSNTQRSLIMGEGSVLEFDASLAASPSTTSYQLQLPSQYAGSQPILYIRGVLANPAIIRSNASGANARVTTSGVNYTGLMDAEHCTFLRMGSSSANCLTAICNADGSDSFASLFRLINCIFDACGMVEVSVNNEHPKVTIENCTWQNSVAPTYCFSWYSYVGTAGSFVRRVVGNVFDMHVDLNAVRGLTCNDNYFHDAFDTINSDSAGWASFSNNFIRLTSGTEEILARGSVVDSFFFYDDSGKTNKHFMFIAGDNGGTGMSVDGCIFEATGTDNTGDILLVGEPSWGAVTLPILNCIMLPNSGGDCSGTPLSALGNSNTTISFNHNTCFVGSQGLAVGETYAGFTGMFSSIRSNIFHDTSARGYKVFDSGTNNSVSDLVSAANLDYNCGYNLLTGSNLKGYNNLEFSSGSPGANDVDENPNFVDSARDLAKWAESLGATGSEATKQAYAITELRKKNLATWDSNFSNANLLAYIRAGFAPQNANLEDAAHDGGDIGAVAVATAQAGTGLSMLTFIG